MCGGAAGRQACKGTGPRFREGDGAQCRTMSVRPSLGLRLLLITAHHPRWAALFFWVVAQVAAELFTSPTLTLSTLVTPPWAGSPSCAPS